MRMPTQGLLDMLNKKYTPGTRVALESMDDPHAKIPRGTEGTVKFVDDMATIHVSWDNGSSLGVVFGEDRISLV